MSEEDLEKEWDAETNRIYDDTYAKTYKHHMKQWTGEPDRFQYEAQGVDLAINQAEDAVKEYLSWLTRPKEAV